MFMLFMSEIMYKKIYAQLLNDVITVHKETYAQVRVFEEGGKKNEKENRC